MDRAEVAVRGRILNRKPPAPEEDFSEKHYRPKELAKLWGISAPAVRNIFKGEPGVKYIGQTGSVGKRSYTTLMIPASVAQRVYANLPDLSSAS